eukprot:263635_1
MTTIKTADCIDLKSYLAMHKVEMDSFGDSDNKAKHTTSNCLPIKLCVYFTSLLLFSLVIWFSAHLQPPHTESIVKDEIHNITIKVTFDIEFHSIPCVSLNIDNQDFTGNDQIAITKNTRKQRLSLDGKSILGTQKHSASDEILFRYMRMDNSKEGCRINGTLQINKTSGNFHSALGAASVVKGRHIHQFMFSDIPRFNASHTIHHLSFGESYKNQQSPLDGTKHIIENEFQGATAMRYHLTITPVRYMSPFGYHIYSNMYDYWFEYTQTNMTTIMQSNSVLPGVFFVYHYSPYMLQIDERISSIKLW